ncbi:hypothetical protein AB5I41_12265 [Sphingomonas sp. MMS24-JH45]
MAGRDGVRHPARPLADDAPLYDRPHVPTPPAKALVDVPECRTSPPISSR